MTELFQIRHRIIANRFDEFFIPPLYYYSLGIPETLLLTPHSFHVSDHFSIDFNQPILFLTQTFYYQPNCRVFIPDSYICVYSTGFVFRPVD